MSLTSSSKKSKNTNETEVEKKKVLISVHTHEHTAFLNKILESSESFFEFDIYVVTTEKEIYCKDSEGVTFLCHDDEKYREVLKTAKFIITDNVVPEKILLNKKQVKIFLPCLDLNIETYPQVQKTLRLSDYNFFSSKESAESILDFYGLKYVLYEKNIIYSLDNINSFFECVFMNKKENIELLPAMNKENNIMIYIGNIQSESQMKMIEKFIKTIYEDSHIHIVSPSMKNYEYIHSLNLSYLCYSSARYSLKQKIMIRFLAWLPFIDKKLQKLFRKNANKNLQKLNYDKIIYLLDNSQYACKELGTLKTQLEYVQLSPMYVGARTQEKGYISNQKFLQKKFQKIATINEYIIDVLHPEICLNNAVDFCMKSLKIQRRNDQYMFKMIIQQNKVCNYDVSQLKLYLNDLEINFSIKEKESLLKLSFSLPAYMILDLPAQNKLFLHYQDKNGLGFKKDIKYTKRRFVHNEYLKSKIFNIDGKTSFYIRQSLKNRVYLTVRLHNRTDSFVENYKINLAYYIAKIFRNKKIYILYEKDSSRYEESASVVYEKLIDLGYHNAYFILDRTYPDLNKISQKYRKNIIYKYTFKHYLFFFISNTFLGSELMVHAMELRIMNKHVLRKIYSTDVNNVFLQHGVMYMISLDSESRKYFTPKKDGKGKFRVVTSSQLEADHFTQLGGYNPKQVIISGLPKYDRNILYPNADKIVIMPTWRVWEYNQATTDFEATPYYKMLQRIVSRIKETYLENLIILPHPLFYKAAMNNEFELKKYMKFNIKYDEILRQTRVLITDYSSIAYDAFYRGSRVIFYWEELQDCLEKYGQNTKLMLNKENVFGDICYSEDDISQVIDENYNFEQKQIYKDRYNQIVKYHDGKNTERLINQLKDEKIID